MKGLTWRTLALLDTVLLALIFTGSIRTALSIGGLEILTKIIWYYLHERAWLRVPGRHQHYTFVETWLGHDTQTRSVSKAVSWRIFGALDTFVISLILTGHVGISGAIGGTEFITKIVLYYLHDRAWSHIMWGRTDMPQRGIILTRAQELTHKLQEYYNTSAAIMYAILALLFVCISALTIYALHTLLR